MKKLVLIAFLLFFINYLFAQKQGTELIDSLKLREVVSPPDTGKVRLLGKLAFQYYKFDTDSGVYYAEQAISLAEKLKWGMGIAFSWNYLGTNYAVKGNYPKALECFINSLTKYSEIGDQQGIAFLSNNLGNFYRIQKNYFKAKEYIERAILLNSGMNNKLDLIKNYNNLGCVYQEISEFAKSDSCYRIGLVIAEETSNFDMVAQLLINVSENQVKIKDFCGALESAIKAVKISETLKIQYDGAIYNGYVGEIYLKLSDEGTKAGQNCIYYSSNKLTNLLSAKKYLTKSIELLKKVNDLSLLSENALLLSQVYEKLGDSGNALKLFKLYSSNKDSVFSADHSVKLANLEKAKEVDLRDNKIKIQNLEIERQQSQMGSQVILFLLILIVISFLLYYYYKTKTAIRLSASEEKYRSIFENLQDIYYSINLDGIIIDISPSIERFSAYKRDEIIGLPVYDFYVNSNDRSLFIDAILEKGELRDWELKFKTKTGEKYVSINARLMYDAGGKPSHINGAMRDITERRWAELELKASREKYHKDLVILNSIFESPVHIIMFALDKNYRYTAFTRFHKETIKMIWGVDIEIGMNMIELISNVEDRKKARHNFDRALAGEHFVENEEYGDSALKRSFYEDYYSSIKNSEGVIVGLSVFVIDVSHRKRAEKQLELLMKAIEQSPVGVLITNKRGEIEYANPNFCEVTGYSYEELMGQNPGMLNSGDKSGEFYKDLWDTILAGKNWFGEFHNKKKNGDFYDESDVISPIFNDDGGISHFVAVKTDITEKKRMVADLINAKEQAEESDKLKTAFLNNISHEIRTPFNGLLGFLALLQYEELTDDEREEYFGIINKSAGRLMNTIDEIVEISQIQTGQARLVLSEFSLDDFGVELSDLFKEQAEKKGLGFSLQSSLSPDNDIIFSDRIKLLAILYHIITNAIKFTFEGSIKIEIHEHGNFLEFSVADTGIGIAEEKLAAIFERFMQADVSSTRQFDGPGLGLTISKAYAELLGGRIRVASEKGKGSRFYLSVPIGKKTGKKSAVKLSTNIDTTKADKHMRLKILIVEDDEQSALLMEIMVRFYIGDILKASTGSEAVDLCRNNRDIDLVLMDIKMPFMDGYEATRQIRLFNPEVVIIAQTAFALLGDREKALEAGCNDYLAKPVKKEQLELAIQKYFIK